MLIMLLVVFVDLLGFGVLIPLLPFYGEHFRASSFTVTMLLSIYSGLQLVAAPLWGRLSDRIGRRPVMLISLTTSVASYLWLSHADALWVLFAARGLQGISAGNISVAQAYVADVTSLENRSKGMGMLGAALGLGFIVGPAIGGLLGGPNPTTYTVAFPAYAAAALSLTALVIAVIFLKESLAPEHRSGPRLSRVAQIREAFSRPRLRLLMSVYFIFTFAFAGMETTFALFAYQRLHFGPRAVGEVFATVGIVLVLIQGGLTGRLTKRFGEPHMLLAGCVASGLGLLALAFSYVTATTVFASCLLATGTAMAQPSTTSLVSREAGPLEHGTILGVNQSTGSLARLLGPAAAGLVFELAGPSAPYLLGACLMVGAGWLATLVIRQHRGAASLTNKSGDDGLIGIRDTARIQ